MLEVSELSIAYGGIPALSEVSIRIDDGEFVAVVGRNRAGKSSLLKAIAGLSRLNLARSRSTAST